MSRPFVTVDVDPRSGNLSLGCEACGWAEDWPSARTRKGTPR